MVVSCMGKRVSIGHHSIGHHIQQISWSPSDRHGSGSWVMVSPVQPHVGCQLVSVNTALLFATTVISVCLWRAGGHHGRPGDRRVAPLPAQWTHVPHLSGHVEEHNDHQRMSAPLLRWLYHHSFEIWVSSSTPSWRCLQVWLRTRSLHRGASFGIYRYFLIVWMFESVSWKLHSSL